MALPFRTLPRSYKKRYPFRIGTTSFIYPAGYTENVARLGPHVDEIEILMFESHPDSRPTRQLVRDLAAQAETLSLTYNIHLPTDLDLTHPDPSRRHNACRILREFIASLMPLEPSVYVLHLPPPDGIRTAEHLRRWHGIAAESLDTWNTWFVNFLSLTYERNVKAISFINTDWHRMAIPGIEEWEDARLQNNEKIYRAWFEETGKARYLKQSAELFEQLGFAE